jgi:hypothetical protein
MLGHGFMACIKYIYIKCIDARSINIYCSTKLLSLLVISKQEYNYVQDIVIASQWVVSGFMLLLQ